MKNFFARLADKRWLMILFLIPLLGLVIFLAIQRFGFFNPKVNNALSPQASTALADFFTLELKTKSLAELKPHPHLTGDSLFDSDHHIILTSDIIIIQTDLWVSGLEIKVNNAATSTLHHAIFFKVNERDPVCPNYRFRMLFVNGSDTIEHLVLPKPHAIFLPKGTPLFLEVLLHNPLPPLGRGETYNNVSVSLLMTGEKDRPGLDKRPVEFFQLHLTDSGCQLDKVVNKRQTFVVPPKSKNFLRIDQIVNGQNPGRYTISKSGLILAAGGHLHAWSGGESLNVFLNDQPFTVFLPTRTSTEFSFWRIPYQYFNPPRKINAGNNINISAIYSNPNSLPISDAMGILGFFFAPDE
jgi:hypothetical protein